MIRSRGSGTNGNDAMVEASQSEFYISVFYEDRGDGGLRAYSSDVPGFILSHDDAELVLKDIIPALETILSEKLGKPVRVTLPSRLTVASNVVVTEFPLKKSGVLEYLARAA